MYNEIFKHVYNLSYYIFDIVLHSDNFFILKQWDKKVHMLENNGFFGKQWFF